MMVGIAAMMFVALFGWGQDYFHWSDPSGKIQLALFTSFILGIICGYKTKQLTSGAGAALGRRGEDASALCPTAETADRRAGRRPALRHAVP